MFADWVIKIFSIFTIAAMFSMMLVFFIIIFSMVCAGFDIITGTEMCYDWCCY